VNGRAPGGGDVWGRWILVVGLALAAAGLPPRARAEEPAIERPPPPALEDFETDANNDGVPDGWYNLRDARLVAEGGVIGPRFLRFENDRPGRPARLSRAFGIDGRSTEAVIIGAWVRLERIQAGERYGEDPGIVIDFLGAELKTASRGSLGPWRNISDGHWTRVAKRIAVPPGTRDAIMSIGLLGAAGVMDIDGLTIDLVPSGGAETTNLIVNGDFELGDPDPASWLLDGGAHRVNPGSGSNSVLELTRAESRAMTGVALPVAQLAALELSVMVRAQNLRGSGGAVAVVFFMEEEGRILAGIDTGVLALRWGGPIVEWRLDRAVIQVPRNAARAVLQFEKTDGNGSIRLDDVKIVASPLPAAAVWNPYHAVDDVIGWMPVAPSPRIAEASALDASFLLDAPAGKHGFVTVRDRHLAFTGGGRARFFGVSLLPPAAFLDRARADALVDRLARSGVNLVRLGDLDMAIGPQRSLYDDSRDDTRRLDPTALERLDHLIAALKARGIYVALELQSLRKYRAGDGVTAFASLPPGGGPAAVFDPVLAQRQFEAAEALLTHVNPETGLALNADPVLVWVTLAGEISMFDQIDNPGVLPPAMADELKTLAQKSALGQGRRFWQSLEADHWKDFATRLRRAQVRVPIAGVSHWRREPEFCAALATPGLDLIDDRLYWNPPLWVDPERCSFLFSHNGALAAGALAKRKADRPYVVGQWCHQTFGAWAHRHEAADTLLASLLAAHEGWDALIRRGVFLYPETWGANAAGTGGGEDIFQLSEALNGIPQFFSLMPHAASLMLRAGLPQPAGGSGTPHPAPPPARKVPVSRRSLVPGWNPDLGRLVIDTPYTQGLAGWVGTAPAGFEKLEFKVDQPFAVVVASSVGNQPIATSRRLLVTAVARVEPTGYRWVDSWKREVADPGRPPLLQEPVRARIRWRFKGPAKAFALDNTGARTATVPLRVTEDGVELDVNGDSPTLHWELVAG
jgi:hypothetical protein